MKETMFDNDNPSGTATVDNTATDNQSEPVGDPFREMAGEMVDELDGQPAQPEAQADDSQEQPEASADDELIDWTDGDKSYKVPKKLHEGFLRQEDYTRKTSEVAQERRLLDMQKAAVNAVTQAAQHFPHVFSNARAAQAEFDRLAKVDAESLRVNDPAAFQEYAAAYSLANVRVQQANQETQKLMAHMSQADAASREQMKAEAVKALTADGPWKVPGWSQTKSNEIASYWASNGIPADRLDKIVSAEEVSILHDAMMYRRMRAANPQAKAQGQKSPTVVPKSVNQLQRGQQQTRDANLVNTLRKAPSKDSFRAALAHDLMKEM